MANTPKGRKEASSATPENRIATPAQQGLPSGDYSYTLELVATLQNTIGRLTEAVESLKQQSKEQGSELKQLSKEIYAAKVVLRLTLGAVVIGGGVIGFFINRVAEMIQAYVTSKPH